MKKIFVIILTLSIIGLLISSNIVYAEEEDPLKFPQMKAYIEGSFDPDGLVNHLRPTQYQLPVEMRGSNADIDDLLFSLNDGFSYVPKNAEDYGVRSIEKVDGHWRVHFFVSLDAPTIIPDMPLKNDGSIKLSKQTGELPVDPDEQVAFGGRIGMAMFGGSDSFLLENDTQFEETDWTFDTDFSIASYPLLVFRDIRSETTSNTTIKLSYGNTTGASMATAATVYNYTIVNEHIPISRDLWYRLDKEIELDGNGTDEVILNIDVTNAVIDERYIVDYSASFQDSRYETIYIGGRDDDDVVSLSGLLEEATVVEPMAADERGGLQLNGFLDSLVNTVVSYTKDLYQETGDTNDGSSYFVSGEEFSGQCVGDGIGDGTCPGTMNLGQGWEDDTVFKKDITEAAAAKTGYGIGDIFDLDLTSSITSFLFPSSTTDEMNHEAQDQDDKSSDLWSVMNNILDNTFPESFLGVGDDLIGDFYNWTNSPSNPMHWGMDLGGGLLGMVNQLAGQFSVNTTNPLLSGGGLLGGLMSMFSKPFSGIGEGIGNKALIFGLGAVAIFVIGIFGYLLARKWLF